MQNHGRIWSLLAGALLLALVALLGCAKAPSTELDQYKAAELLTATIFAMLERSFRRECCR